MNIPENLKYTKNHEWVRLEDGTAWVGISDPAQDALGDIVFVELPEIDSRLETGDVLGVVESVKSASDIYSPVSGIVIKVNEDLTDQPELINEDAYGSWIAQLAEVDISGAELMDPDEYQVFCEEENL